MNKYEITIMTRENPPASGSPVKKEIESLDGKVLSVIGLGQKQLVYPIKKESAAYYTVIVFEADPSKLIDLNQKLSLNPEILRHLILIAKQVKIVAPEKLAKEPSFAPVEKEEKIEAPKPIKEKVEKKVTKPKIEPEKVVGPRPISPGLKEPKVTQAVEKIQKEEVSTEERLKALDKKLDELLKE